jgi:hypothetical protein
MMIMKRMLSFSITMVAALVSISLAQVPQVLNYQGVLTDAGGTAVPDGSYSVTFRFYQTETGGAELWSETQPVQVTKGIFSTYLGTVTALDLPFETDYWLGISVEGEAELAPRVRLASSPYSFTSKAVRGYNIFPDSGYVGINTDSPNYPLEVYGGPSNQVALYVHSADPSWASIYMRADNGSSRPGYGYVRGGLVAHHYVDPGGTWRLSVADDERISVTPAGNVGIGASSPVEKLDVDGAINIGTTSGTFPGTIRWSGADFEGYDGSAWLSLTGAGSGGLPSGSAGQTLRHSGTDWIATSNLYNDGSFVGVGTTSPETNLHVHSTGTPVVRVESDLSTGAAGLMAKSDGGTQDYAMLQKFGSAAGGSKAGVPLADLSLLQVGSQAGPLMLDVIPPEPIHFVIDNSEFMRLTETGRLEVHHGGGAVSSIHGESDGGHLSLYNETGQAHTNIKPDPQGAGGYLSIMRSDVEEGFRLEGNFAGTTEPLLAIFGSSQDAMFNMSETGNFSVELPVDAVGNSEILDEPGVASMIYGESAGIGLTMGNYVVIASRSIIVPAAGYVMVVATSNISIDHTTGAPSIAQFGISHLPNAFNSNQSAELGEPSAAPTALYERIITCHGLYEVISEGTAYFNFIGFLAGGAMTAHDIQLTLCYFPTAYGTVEPTFVVDPVAAAAPDAAERARSIAANEARIERELEAMQSRITELERLLGSQ